MQISCDGALLKASGNETVTEKIKNMVEELSQMTIQTRNCSENDAQGSEGQHRSGEMESSCG